MKQPPYSKHFDDVYFSRDDGLAETRYVFLESSNLPDAWRGKKNFTIAECGFGTGLNFFAAWDLFEQTADDDAVLDFISFEKYPLAPDEISDALEPWQKEFNAKIETLLAQYPLRINGFHRLYLTPQIRLTLVFDDINLALPELTVPCGVDAWFLDGFAPAKNPDMWSDTIFENMARLSHEHTTLATFTAAGDVRRGLEKAGFTIQKKRGYGHKRDMVVGNYNGSFKQIENNKTKRIAIIGGGLAGTSCAYRLKQQGLISVLFEKSDVLAAGASGNIRGLYNPKFRAEVDPESIFYQSAFNRFYKMAKLLDDTHGIDFKPCGGLHLVMDDEQALRTQKFLNNETWHYDHLRLVQSDEASKIAGQSLEKSALYLNESGSVSLEKTCRAYTHDVDVRLKTEILTMEKNGEEWQINGENFDAVILACAVAVQNLLPDHNIPIHVVRGQVTHIEPRADLNCNICYGGYITPHDEGFHLVGATYQKWRDDNVPDPADDEENLEKLNDVIPSFKDSKVIGHRASFRTVSRDHFPLIGKVTDNLYVTTAHSSLGLISSIAGADLIADMISRAPYSLPQSSIDKLNPLRFNKTKH